MSKRTITLPLHMKAELVERAKIACELEGIRPNPETIHKKVQEYAYESYINSLTPNPGTPKITPRFHELDNFFFREDGVLMNAAESIGTREEEVVSLFTGYKKQFTSIINSAVMLWETVIAKQRTMRGTEKKTKEMLGEKIPVDPVLPPRIASGFQSKKKGASIADQKRAIRIRIMNRIIGAMVIKLLRIVFTMTPDQVNAIIDEAYDFKEADWKKFTKPSANNEINRKIHAGAEAMLRTIVATNPPDRIQAAFVDASKGIAAKGQEKFKEIP